MSVVKEMWPEVPVSKCNLHHMTPPKDVFLHMCLFMAPGSLLLRFGSIG